LDEEKEEGEMETSTKRKRERDIEAFIISYLNDCLIVYLM